MPDTPIQTQTSIKMWAVTTWTRPTFYLHPDVSGILTREGARRIAADVMGVDIDLVVAALVDIDS